MGIGARKCRKWQKRVKVCLQPGQGDGRVGRLEGADVSDSHSDVPRSWMQERKRVDEERKGRDENSKTLGGRARVCDGRRWG